MRLKEECREEIVINKSRFIACACPCSNEEEARAYIEVIRKEFPDATHVCTAYICGENGLIQRSNDNKEPSGTAGMPMLEAIKHSGLQDVCCCVVRYFGGIKLGAGGLIRAYSGAVTQVLTTAEKVEEIKVKQYEVTYPYDLSGVMENWLRRYTDIVDTQYSDQVTVTFETDLEQVEEQINNLTRGQIKPHYKQDVMRLKDVNSLE